MSVVVIIIFNGHEIYATLSHTYCVVNMTFNMFFNEYIVLIMRIICHSWNQCLGIILMIKKLILTFLFHLLKFENIHYSAYYLQ